MKMFAALMTMIALLAGTSVVATAQNQDADTAIQQRLESEYPLTKTTADKSDIVTVGAVLVLQKDNLLMCAINNPIPEDNTYKKGRIGQNFGKGFLKGLGNMMATGQDATDVARRTFVTGEKFWLLNVSVVEDGVILRVYSDPFDGVRYWADLKFPFKKPLPSPDVVLKTIAQVVTVDTSQQDNASAPGEQPAEAPPPVEPPPPPAAESAPPPPIAPPPPPPDEASAPPPTVSLGQTRAQVEAILGQPLHRAKVGVKEIYTYKELKVIFINGKVKDIQ